MYLLRSKRRSCDAISDSGGGGVAMSVVNVCEQSSLEIHGHFVGSLESLDVVHNPGLRGGALGW